MIYSFDPIDTCIWRHSNNFIIYYFIIFKCLWEIYFIIVLGYGDKIRVFRSQIWSIWWYSLRTILFSKWFKLRSTCRRCLLALLSRLGFARNSSSYWLILISSLGYPDCLVLIETNHLLARLNKSLDVRIISSLRRFCSIAHHKRLISKLTHFLIIRVIISTILYDTHWMPNLLGIWPV